MMKRRMWNALFVILMVLLSVQVSSAAAPKKLLVAVTNEPTNMDPCLGIAGNDLTITQNFAEYLIYKAPSGDLKPGLATSWKMSPDGMKVAFTLRKGVKFHTGDPLTVQDVEFSFKRAMQDPVKKARLGTLQGVEVVDSTRFNILFKEPDATFIPNGGNVMIVSKNYYDKVGEDAFIKTPIGTGPYKFVSYSPGEYVDMERFEGYWGQKPQVKEARFFFITEDTTRTSKLKAGEVDIIATCPFAEVREFEKSAEFKVIRYEVNSPNKAVAFANRNPNAPWSKKSVRLALAYAIDWKSIIDTVLYGIPNHLMYLSPTDLGYDPGIKPYPYDPKKAKEMLAQAGYPNGFELPLYFGTGRSSGDREISEAVAGYFEAVGVRTKLIPEEHAAMRARVRSAKTASAIYVGMVNAGMSGTADASYTLNLFLSSEGSNSVYSNPELDKIAREAKATVNDKKRAELLRKAQRILYEDVAVIPICSIVQHYVVKKNVNFVPTKKFQFDIVLVKDVTIK